MADKQIEAEDRSSSWPANRLPERLDDWSHFADSDREAGFRFTDDFERFSQHDDIFNRAWWDPAVMSDDVVAFYNAQLHPAPRRADGFTQWDFALVNASWSVARDYAMRGRKDGVREGFLDHFRTFVPRAEQQADVPTPKETAARIKKVAKFLGADLVGITAYDERWTYSQSSDALSKTRDEKDNLLPDGMTSVIVLGHGMDYDLVESYPSALAASATGREYSREASIVSSLAGFIEALGYSAFGSSNDTGVGTELLPGSPSPSGSGSAPVVETSLTPVPAGEVPSAVAVLSYGPSRAPGVTVTWTLIVPEVPVASVSAPPSRFVSPAPL